MTAVNGYRWATDVADNAGRILLIAGILGAPAVVIAINHYPFWWTVSGVCGALLLILGEGTYRTWEDAMARALLPPTEGATLPVLRMDSDLTADFKTPNHVVYFRLRFWNDGGGAITPEVLVSRVVLGDGSDASFSPQLPLTLGWSSRSVPPSLTRHHTGGETVGVLGMAIWHRARDMGLPVGFTQLYVAGSEHQPLIDRTQEKVHIQIQAILPGQLQGIERWFWVQVTEGKSDPDEKMKFDWGPASGPPEAPSASSTAGSQP
jgi:hypothetical protein